MVFVIANCLPITTAGLVESDHVTGGAKLGADCNVKPAAFVSHERMSSLPFDFAFKVGSNGTVPIRTTV